MTLAKLTTLIGFVFALSACGGSGGGSSSPSPSTGGNSSTGGTSGTSGTPNTPSSGLVFGDNLNPEYGVLRSYEYIWKDGSGNGMTNYDGQAATQFMQWKTVESPSAEHKTVIEVNYNNQDNTWAQLHVSPKTPQNLSTYATGTLSFDINILNWGDAYDPATGKATFEVRLECKWPCSSHGFMFDVRDYNVWQHVTISAADLALSGADFSQLDSTLIIKPLKNKQKNCRYQLDNIEWTKGTITPNKPNIVFAEHFNTQADIDSWIFVPVRGQLPSNNLQKFNWGDGVFVQQPYGSSEQDWELEKTLSKKINIENKNVSVQILFSGGGDSYLNFIATDSNGRTASTGNISVLKLKHYEPTQNTWNLISFNTNSAGFAGDDLFNPNSVSKISIRYTTRQSNGFFMYIDEIVITD